MQHHKMACQHMVFNKFQELQLPWIRTSQKNILHSFLFKYCKKSKSLWTMLILQAIKIVREPNTNQIDTCAMFKASSVKYYDNHERQNTIIQMMKELTLHAQKSLRRLTLFRNEQINRQSNTIQSFTLYNIQQHTIIHWTFHITAWLTRLDFWSFVHYIRNFTRILCWRKQFARLISNESVKSWPISEITKEKPFQKLRDAINGCRQPHRALIFHTYRYSIWILWSNFFPFCSPFFKRMFLFVFPLHY